MIRKTPIKRTANLQTRTPMPRKRPGTRRRIDAEGRVAIPIAGKARLAHFERVAALGCIACLIDGNPGTPAELHHIRETAGGGQKALDSDVISVCPAHHRGTDHPRTPSIHLDRLAFIAKYGSEKDLLIKVRELLGGERQ